jgi:hypothetical protein
MEFWEGAVLVVGGIWLVGHMSAKSAVGQSASIVKKPTVQVGNTTLTNTAGTSSLVAGEPLTPAGPLVGRSTTVVSTPVTSAPVHAPVVGHNNLMPATGRMYQL